MKKFASAALAVTAALTFASVPVTSALAASKTGSVHCMGVNACKGKSACKTADSSCKGINSCKGKGVMMMKSAKACKKAGGTVS